MVWPGNNELKVRQCEELYGSAEMNIGRVILMVADGPLPMWHKALATYMFVGIKLVLTLL